MTCILSRTVAHYFVALAATYSSGFGAKRALSKCVRGFVVSLLHNKGADYVR